MLKLNDLFNKLIYPLMVLVLTPSAIAIGSYMTTGNVMDWIYLVPWWGWNLSFGVNTVWIIAIIVTHRLKEIKKPGISVTPFSSYGYGEIGSIDYADVKWRVQAPFKEPWGGLLDYTPKRIRISTPPRCPKCETKIEEEKTFWGGYIWKCPTWDFSKRSQQRCYNVSKSVENIAQRDVELMNKEHKK